MGNLITVYKQPKSFHSLQVFLPSNIAEYILIDMASSDSSYFTPSPGVSDSELYRSGSSGHDGDEDTSDESGLEIGLTPYNFEPRCVAPAGSSVEMGSCDFEEEVGYKPENRAHNTNWCECEFCPPMETNEESMCCIECSAISSEKFEGMYFCSSKTQLVKTMCFIKIHVHFLIL